MLEWYEFFKEFDDNQFIDTVSNHIANEPYQPSMASIIKNKTNSKLPLKIVDREML